MRTRIPCLPQLIRSAAPTADLVPDRSLLAEFVSSRSGIAFELLVRRHGPAVWSVCRRHLANGHDAEDAFQATFLVLARSAKRISKSNSVGSWLLGVAYRVALKARRTTARRKRVEAVVTPADEPAVLPVQPAHDTTAIVHAELERLPDRYRLPLLLCDLEGLSRKEASAQLGWSEGTLSGRLNRARKLLAGRLTGRGVAAGVLVGVATFAFPSYAVAAAVSVGRSTLDTTIPAAPATVAALARGAMRDMTRTFVTKLSAGMLAAGLLVAGGVVGLRFEQPVQAAPVPKDNEKVKPEDVSDALAQLVTQPAVQRELKLSAEQRVRLIDGMDKLEAEMEKALNQIAPDGGVTFPAFPGGGQAVPVPQPAPAVPPGGADPAAPGGTAPGAPGGPNPWEKQQKAQRELVASVLTKGQLVRLQQCEVQVLGPVALKLKRVADELKLSDDQKKDVEKAMQNMGFGGAAGGPAIDLPAQVPPPLPGGGGVAPGFPGGGVVVENPQKAAEDALAEIVKGFSAAQTKTWKNLTGEKVAFEKQRVRDRWPGYWSVIAPAPDGREGGTESSGPVAPPANVPPVFGPGGGIQILPAPAPAQPVPPPANPGK